MIIQNLRFFDSDSNDLNLVYNQDTELWEGVCYLPEVSTGLYETLTIHILERAIGKLGNEKYVTPTASSANKEYYTAKLLNDYEYSDDIFLYSASNDGGELFVKKDDTQTGELLDNLVVDSIDPTTGFIVVNSNATSTPISYNIALNSEVESYHTRMLNIYGWNDDNNDIVQVANIRIYGETEAEDERLRVLLSNMGMLLEESDYFIFKKSDIKELSTDWKILNEKRKELLLQASQIKPFIGTYKALLNAIDFFGYDKITLKEYWLNINEQSENFGKLKAVAVPNQKEVGFLSNKSNDSRLPNSNLKKTSRFSLVYRLNEADGGVDEWDIPTVKESLDFSPDEVLIKLYGLKRKLQRDYLPLQAKIVDITGEGDYFSQFNMNVWNNQHVIKDQTAGSVVEFKKFPEERQLFIEDLRKVDYRLTGIGQSFPLATLSDTEDVIESIHTFYDSYYDLDLSTFNTIAGIPIGSPVVLSVDSYKETWDDAQFTWMDSGKQYTGDSAQYNFYDDFPAHPSGNPSLNYFDFLKANEPYDLITWDNWWKRNIYEIEWIISGPNGYLKTYRGSIDTYSNFPITLPYTGDYDVELALYDLFNIRSSYRKPSYINVKSKNVEIYGLTQRVLPKLNWNNYKFEWDIAGSDWDHSAENTQEVDDIIATYYLTLDRANYVHDANDVGGHEFSTVRRFTDSTSPTGFSETTGPYRWNELKTHLWNDGTEVDWNMTRVGSDINASFKMNLNGFANGHIFYMTQYDVLTNTLVTDSYTITSTYPTSNSDLAAWDNIANELNSLNPIDHPILSKFNYNQIEEDLDNDGFVDVCNYMLVVGKEPIRSHDYEDVGFNNPLGGEIILGSKQHHESYNPNFYDIDVIDSHKEIKILNHITLSYDTSNMPGIVSQKWVLRNSTINVDDIYYNNKWLTHLFKHRGDYQVELELTDINGNKNSINKNIIKII